MAIKKIMSKYSKDRNKCIRCEARLLSKLEEERIVKCRRCGCGHLVHFTKNGNLSLTDVDYQYLFKNKEDDNKELFQKMDVPDDEFQEAEPV